MNVSEILRNKRVQHALVASASATLGAVGGYFIGLRKARIHVHITREKSIFDKDHPITKAYEESKTIETMTTTVEEFEIIGDGETQATVTVVLSDDGGWDMEAELATRGDGTQPYIIHQDEYINDEMGFHQSTVTYYAGDNIMADTDDTVIYNHDATMGPLRFGHGTRDETVVYIRNEGIMQEWEVMFNPGHYAQEVMGLQMEQAAEDELRHSVLKFRRD